MLTMMTKTTKNDDNNDENKGKGHKHENEIMTKTTINGAS